MEENKKAREKVMHMNLLRAQARQRMNQGSEGDAAKSDEVKKPEDSSKPAEAKKPEPQKSNEAKKE